MGGVRLPVLPLAFSGLPQFLRVIWAIPLWAVANAFLLLALDALLLVVRHAHAAGKAFPNGRIVDTLAHIFQLPVWSGPDSFDRLAELWTLGVIAFPLILLYFSLLSAAAARSALWRGRWQTAYLGVGRDENRVALVFVEYLAFAAVLSVSVTAFLVPAIATYRAMAGVRIPGLFEVLFPTVWTIVFFVSWSLFCLAIPISLHVGTFRSVSRSFVLTRRHRTRLFSIYILSYLLGLAVALPLGTGLALGLEGIMPAGSASLVPDSFRGLPAAHFLAIFPFSLLLEHTPPTLAELVDLPNIAALLVQSLMIAVLTLFTVTPMVRAYQRFQEAGIVPREPDA